VNAQWRCVMHAKVMDRRRQRVALLATSASGGTRCNIGWDQVGQHQENELWVFAYPDAR
jgi:hypothetical protein